MIFFSSDHHFDHANIIKYSGRPYADKNEMNADMIERWNEVVKPSDTVYHLGDVGFTNRIRLKKIRDSLNGTILLLRGNHDGSVNRMKDSGFEVIPRCHVTIEGVRLLLSHNLIDSFENAWNLHGHIHFNPEAYDSKADVEYINTDKKRINVNVEFWDYYPIPFSTIKAITEGRVP